MKRKPLAVVTLIIVLSLFLFSCGGIPYIKDTSSPDKSSAAGTSEPPPKPPEPVFASNPLTGLKNLDPAAENGRPAAVMINNVKVAWGVQTGLCAADIVYETLVEGGITRLMALYKDYAKAPDLGTVRSARYSYAELALGHDAIYISSGADPVYYMKHYKEINLDWYNLGARSGGYRINNGKAYEHTLYTSGNRLKNGFDAYKGLRREIKKSMSGNAFNFAAPGAVITPAGGACTHLTVVFSSAYKSGYEYQPKTGLYLKTQGDKPHSDYKTKKQIAVKNVFVLFSDITMFPDNIHVKTDLDKGSGYYISEGAYEEITWSKGAPSSPLVFTDAAGKPLKVNAGSSWISFTDKSNRSKLALENRQ